MNRLYVAKLKIKINKNWNMGFNFDYSVKEGLFEYDKSSNIYKGVEDGNLVMVSSDISCKTGDNILEFCQGFSNPLSKKDLETIKEGMQERFLGIMQNYKEKYC